MIALRIIAGIVGLWLMWLITSNGFGLRKDLRFKAAFVTYVAATLCIIFALAGHL